MRKSQTEKFFQDRVAQVLKAPKTRKIAWWTGGFFVAFGLFGFFAGPPIAKWVLLDALSSKLHRPVSIDSIDINPYALSARLHGVSVGSEAGPETAGFDELYVNLSTFSILQAGLVVDEVRLTGPRVRVTRVAEGRYDISDLLDEWMKPSEGSTPRFSVNNIQVSGGKIEFDDQPVGKKHAVTDLELKIPFISSLPYQADIVVQPAFSAKFNGSPVVLQGNAKPFDGSYESELMLDAHNIELGNLAAYLPERLPFRLHGGVANSELKILFRQQEKGVFSISLNGGANLAGLDLRTAAGQPLLAWKKLDLKVRNADIINRQFDGERLYIDGLETQVAVSQDGVLNWIDIADRLGAPGKTAPESAKEAAKEPAKPLLWSLGEFRLTNGVVHWRDESNPTPVAGKVHDIDLTVGPIDSKLEAPITLPQAAYGLDLGDAAQVASIALKNGRLDLKGHRVEFGEIAVQGGSTRLLRNKAGKVEWVNSPVLKTAKEVKEEYADARPWVIAVEKLAVADLGIRFEDMNTSPTAVQTVEGLHLQGEKLSNAPGNKNALQLEARVNGKGTLKVGGDVQLQPLAANLHVETLAIPLMPLQPYFTEYMNISLTRGLLSSQGDVSLQMGKEGLLAGYQGQLTLGELLTVDKVNSADFLRWKSLHLGNIDFKAKPLTVNVGEVALSDFYSRLIVSPEGRLNLFQIVKQPGQPETQAVPPPPPKSAEGRAGAGAPAPDVAPETALMAPEGKPAPLRQPEGKAVATVQPGAPAKETIPIRIGKVTLQGGTVNFSDRFVKPNYTVNLTKLGGRISGLSSAPDTVADLDVRGSYANTAPVLIQAKLNPLTARSFLDLKAEIKGVDLVPLSTYAGKYAGYNIDKGKLSLFVAYKLKDGQLQADNRVFLDQLTFGSKVDSPDATTLPVNLAVSLLKNGRGEIDINLPISGSLEDPEFSLGGLVVKVIINLFVKAVTSPFALLGSMFGGGEELSNVEFEPGRRKLSDDAVKKLEALAKALADRPALKLEITGRVDPEADKEGIKRVAMERAARAEKLKEQVKKGIEGSSLNTVELTPEEYPIYLERAYKEAKFPKPRNLVGMQKSLPVEEMEKLMIANLPATEEDMRQLAERRAERVQSWLVEEGKVDAERLFIMPPKLAAQDKEEGKEGKETAKAKGSRVDFSLR